MKTKKPNIILIMTDDTSPEYLGYHGYGAYTPNLDKLAHQGVYANHFHSVSPVCTPSRYAWMTGHAPQKCPAPSMTEKGKLSDPAWISFNCDFEPERETGVALELQKVGYRTGFTGKWHTGGIKYRNPALKADSDLMDPKIDTLLKDRYKEIQNHIHHCGFDYADGVQWDNCDFREIEALRVHNMSWLCERSLKFIDDSAKGDQPFYLNICPTVLHGPHHLESLYADERLTEAGLLDGEHIGCLPERSTVVNRLEERKLIGKGAKSCYPYEEHIRVGMLWLDDMVGKVLEKLEEYGLAENTAIIFSSDHGCGRRGKFTLYEGGTSIPFAMRWPGVIKAGEKTDAFFTNLDLLPTAMDIAGEEAPKEAELDGKSVLPLLKNSVSSLGNEEIYTEFGYSRALRDGRWKIILRRPPQESIDKMKNNSDLGPLDVHGRYSKGPSFYINEYPGYYDLDQLYDLEMDPEEQNNLATHPMYQDIFESMKNKLIIKMKDMPWPFNTESIDPYIYTKEHREKIDRARRQSDLYELNFFRQGG